MRVADEQGLLCEVKKQQLKVLDDQQKLYADDLSKSVQLYIIACRGGMLKHCYQLPRSMEDTERARYKYLKAKKVYEEKVKRVCFHPLVGILWPYL